jgi:hypothetical protein
MCVLLTCDVCHAVLELSEPDVVAAAEVVTFADAHGEHAAWAFRLNSTFGGGRGATGGALAGRPLTD